MLSIQQREGEATTGANFTALRLRRDVLANSDIGAILLNKEENGPHFNRVAGLDANFRFGDLTVNTYIAKSFSPDLALQDLASTSGNAYRAVPASTIRAGRGRSRRVTAGLASVSTTRSASCPAGGIDNFDGRFGRRIRPPALSNWLRQMQPHIELDLFLRQDDGTLETSYQGYHWNFNFQDGSNAEFGVNRMIEDVPEHSRSTTPLRRL